MLYIKLTAFPRINLFMYVDSVKSARFQKNTLKNHLRQMGLLSYKFQKLTNNFSLSYCVLLSDALLVALVEARRKFKGHQTASFGKYLFGKE